mgnify:CR=1 FL=1
MAVCTYAAHKGFFTALEDALGSPLLQQLLDLFCAGAGRVGAARQQAQDGVTASLEWMCPPIPLALFERFAGMARESCPLEAAGWITWNEVSNEFAFREVGVREASASRIHFDRPRLGEGEHLVVDLHSHGRSSAFFSGTDDEDDRGEVKLSVVLGRCDQKLVTAQRLCLMGMFVPMQLASAVDGLMFKPAPVEEPRTFVADALV